MFGKGEGVLAHGRDIKPRDYFDLTCGPRKEGRGGEEAVDQERVNGRKLPGAIPWRDKIYFDTAR